MIKIRKTHGKTWTATENLKLWDKNPRIIKEEDFNRLKKQLADLGQYKPLLVTEDGVVVGGNMRFRAYADLGVKELWVSILSFADIEGKPGVKSVLIDGKFQIITGDTPREFQSIEHAMLEYAISDNDHAGKTDTQVLAELANPYMDVVPMENYKIEVYESKPLVDVAESISSPAPEVREDSEAEVEEMESVVFAIKYSKEEWDSISFLIEDFKEGNGEMDDKAMFENLLGFWRNSNLPVAGTVEENGDVEYSSTDKIGPEDLQAGIDTLAKNDKRIITNPEAPAKAGDTVIMTTPPVIVGEVDSGTGVPVPSVIVAPITGAKPTVSVGVTKFGDNPPETPEPTPEIPQPENVDNPVDNITTGSGEAGPIAVIHAKPIKV